MNRYPETKRVGLLHACFGEGTNQGLSQDEVRSLAPQIIGCRMSMADNSQLYDLLLHLKGERQPPKATRKYKYEPSLKGLKQELKDAAMLRWGNDFEVSLNAFINHGRKVKTSWKFLDVAGLKAVKERIKQLNKQDGIF